MKTRITLNPECKKLFILLFPFLLITGSCFTTQAQGWSFTPSIVQTDCGNSSYTSTANAMLATFSTNVKLPTQPQCEAIRQMLNGFSTGGDWYSSGNPPVLHHCSLTITCTACTGSDMNTPGQVNPGDVSFNGQTDGKPLFTPHQSEAFEDWARDYKALLESYGITSILGNRLTPHPVPRTGDKDVDRLYDSLAAKFNPPVPPRNPPNQNPNVVDLSDKKGVVKLLTTEEEQKQRDKFYQEHLQEQGINDLAPISPTNGITGQPEGSTWDLQKTQHLLFVGAGIAATAAILLAAAPEVATVGVVAALGEEVGAATVISWSLPVIEESVKAIENCVSGNCPTTGQILVNMGVGEISNVVGTTGEIAGGIASAATQRAIGTISTQGVNIVKYTWNVSFGATDAVVQGWGAINEGKKK
jgi:hypothetical protein